MADLKRGSAIEIRRNGYMSTTFVSNKLQSESVLSVV